MTTLSSDCVPNPETIWSASLPTRIHELLRRNKSPLRQSEILLSFANTFSAFPQSISKNQRHIGRVKDFFRNSSKIDLLPPSSRHHPFLRPCSMRDPLRQISRIAMPPSTHACHIAFIDSISLQSHIVFSRDETSMPITP